MKLGIVALGERRRLLFAAAHQASVAVEALLRAATDDEPVDEETVEKLADAAKLLVEAEFDLVADRNQDLGQLQAALVRFLDGWAG